MKVSAPIFLSEIAYRTIASRVPDPQRPQHWTLFIFSGISQLCLPHHLIYTMSVKALPVISLKDLETEEGRQRLAEQFAGAASTFGFMQIVSSTRCS